MADVKISALPAVVTAATTDIFAIVQGGVTYKATLTQVVAAITSTGLTATAGALTVNLSTGVAGGQSVIGGTAASNSLTLSSTSNATKGKILFGTSAYDEVNNRLGIGTASPDRPLDVNGTARIQERLTVSQDNTVATQVVSVINTDTANCGMVIAPSGTGAIMASIPDGTATGGNARGQYAVDLQTLRSNNAHVASGNNGAIIGGERNTASGGGSFVGAGYNNVASGLYGFCLGESNNISGRSSGGFGNSNWVTSDSGIGIGLSTLTTLRGQFSRASGTFANTGDAQTSSITLRRSITGTGIQELFLNGSSERAILNISTFPGPTNARAWRAQIDLVAIVQTVGNGTVVLGECFMGSYHVGIKRIGTATSLVGTVSVTNEVSDTNMSTAVTTITADDTNEALKIEFTPPTAAGSTTVIRVVATAYLTEVGY